ncbi:MAG: hypothetical protein DRI84_02590 [Bacteroidetes bacterium]|nr:MAG: hypothetical protein DRI84_02590 [Bacteroidota bacterium]
MSKFKEFFSFNKAERRGVFVLLILIMILLIYRVFGPFTVSRMVDQSEFDYEVANFLKSTEKPNVQEKQKEFRKKKSTNSKKQIVLQLHPFDPNLMTHRQWLEMGLSERQARTIEKYKSKGGRFREPEDFKKMYCITETEYEKLSPYIIINIPENDESSATVEPILNISLNNVGMEEIQCVRGIGPSYAKRIIKYRQLLGGYVNVSQLMEVYGMDSSRYLSISPHFTVGLDSIKQISINAANYSQLRRHPYISDQLAYEITHYRSLHGDYRKLEDLKKINLVNESLYQKIYLYFAVESK